MLFLFIKTVISCGFINTDNFFLKINLWGATPALLIFAFNAFHFGLTHRFFNSVFCSYVFFTKHIKRC